MSRSALIRVATSAVDISPLGGEIAIVDDEMSADKFIDSIEYRNQFRFIEVALYDNHLSLYHFALSLSVSIGFSLSLLHKKSNQLLLLMVIAFAIIKTLSMAELHGNVMRVVGKIKGTVRSELIQ